MIKANLTRFGPATLALGDMMEAKSSNTFKALRGPAQLIIGADRVQSLSIRLNGKSVVEPGVPLARGEQVRDVQLASDNTIDISCTGEAGGSLTVRIKQTASADIGLLRQGYFGLNTSDMERQRTFYQLLGFKGEIYPAGPETSESFARSLGFKDNYLIHVSLHSLENPPTMPFVDTVQFRGDSYRDEPPYAKLNHLGMSYATYSTTNLDGDYAWLRERGVEFLSAPATAPDGERFVFFNDQDGAFLKLIAVEGESRADEPNLKRLVNTNMNVSDLERSREFYRLLGFTESIPASQSGGGEFAKAHGFAGTIEFEGVDVSLGEGTDGATLQLRQWKSPYDDAAPYPPPVNHLGIDRINFYVKDLNTTVKAMTDLGFTSLGPVGGMPAMGIGIVFFFDPDGIKVQLAGPWSFVD